MIQRNIIDVPIKCSPGKKPDRMGRCKEVWRKPSNDLENRIAKIQNYLACKRENSDDIEKCAHLNPNEESE